MGASQSVQDARGIPPEAVQREMELIHRRLDAVAFPNQATGYADILPHYRGVISMIDPKSMQQTIAVIHLMISSHAKATRLSTTYASLTAELFGCQKMLITLHTKIRSSNIALMQVSGAEETAGQMNVDAIKDCKIKELADTITSLVNQLDLVQTHSFRILHVMLKASEACTSGHNHQPNTAESNAELSAALQTLDDTSVAVSNRISSVMSNYTKAVERIRMLEENKKHQTDLVEQLTANVKLANDEIEALMAHIAKLTASLKMANDEIQALKARNAKLAEDCREKNRWVCDMKAKINGMGDTMKRAESIVLAEKDRLRKQTRDQEEMKQLKAEVARLKDQSNKVEALHAENARLKVQSTKAEALRAEISGLKRKLKESNIKDLEKRLHEANAELDHLRALSKDQDDDGDRPQDDHDTHIDAASSDEEGASTVVEGLSFAEGAARILQCHKAVLAELRAQISTMKDVRGGSGWSIVHRTDAMVKRKTGRMLKDIDDCLALRDAGEREKERVERLETEGFPAL
ncbi:hypothetical protein A1O7_07363 [Cladophialophora yegresii CBS 114405]|uniref:Uncharacterized protein n=1 Tax=Cladophialophora yegresii CBS 114405 TaxID=1182544 RepID=W9WER4_9EURO|nr:uncharacterized protein A1O7_07363 [Cladophialophora yegresii CBS 114405]EXJ57019.1 hypothetical protein A1O7_07363 [Cladophialophora yegresii CBS 114405]